MRSVGWVGWSTKRDRIAGTSGGSSKRPAIKVYDTQAKAHAYTNGDSTREIFIKEPHDDE